MKRFACLAILAMCSGCGTDSSPSTSNSENQRTNPDFLDDYAKWPQLTNQPVRMPVALAFDCRAPQMPIADRYGPHYSAKTSVRYFISPTSETSFRSGVSPMPVGTTVVKEKWICSTEGELLMLNAVAAMVKREPGYAKEQGDWEYIYATDVVAYGNPMKVERGQIATCVECHTKTWQTDYLFRSYLVK